MTSGGFAMSNNADAIDAQPQLENPQFFDWMKSNTKLLFEPGTQYQYYEL